MSLFINNIDSVYELKDIIIRNEAAGKQQPIECEINAPVRGWRDLQLLCIDLENSEFEMDGGSIVRRTTFKFTKGVYITLDSEYIDMYGDLQESDALLRKVENNKTISMSASSIYVNDESAHPISFVSGGACSSK
ncbi:hypothetical protein [Vibrio splendidus]|uniref:hypothetical protein n=1 Tax=Vibrio splendidus TaxID=29497 RepID=UPI000769F4EA|nr:hypothetical protein [Vibrio splendidus]